MMDITPGGAFRPTDCDGLSVPDHEIGSVDLAASVSALEVAERAATGLRQAIANGAPPDEARCFRSVLTAIEALGPCSRATAFGAVPAAMDTASGVSHDDGIEDARSPLERARTVARYVIGCPDATVHLVLPPSAVGDGLYLPHLHAVLRGPAPVAVESDPAVTRVTWADGFAMTLPTGDRHVARASPTQRLLPVAAAEGIPILNQAPEILRACGEFDPCPPASSASVAERIAEGLRFLRNVWPSAHGAITRHVGGIVALNRREHARSHSPLSMGRVVLVSDEDEVLVGDLLIHEASHIRLNLFRQFDSLFEDRQPEMRHVSPWRRDLRPVSGLVLGVHAFLNVCHYYRRVAAAYDAADARRVADLQREKVKTAWARAKPFLRPTPLGAAFLADLDARVTAL
jgi:HEXXH motif-containing protein